MKLPSEIREALRPVKASTLDELDTPCVLIEARRVEANLRRAQDHLAGLGLRVRPHIKTHKIPAIAHWARRLGACGLTVQKIGEAEVMADAGLDDIFLPYNILGAGKLARLRALHERVVLSVTADAEPVVAGYAEAFRDAARPLSVLVECDTGAGRCGVQDADEAVALARAIDAAAGLRFAGLMTYPPAGAPERAAEWLGRAIEALEAAGLPPERVSGGGTPDLTRAGEVPMATEHRPGTYVYSDLMQVAHGHGTLEDCALTVLTTVVSRPTPDRAVLDAGSKALTSDLVGRTGHGLIREAPRAVIAALSEEHGTVETNGESLAIGQRVRVVPNHACPVTNLFDEVVLIDGNEVLGSLAVLARGRVA